MGIDGKKVINNIYILAKEKKVKIGDLEKFADVSAGYLSKLLKEDRDAIPGTETLYKISQKLNVTVDDLLTIDYSAENPTILFLISFLDKLINETNLSKVNWCFESPSRIIDNSNPHPLFIYNVDGDLVYNSQFWDYKEDCSAYPNDNIYYFLNNESLYYLVQVDISTVNIDYVGYEMYVFNKKTKMICSTSLKPSIINAKLDILYQAVKEYVSKPKIDDDVKNAIDLFMKE